MQSCDANAPRREPTPDLPLAGGGAFIALFAFVALAAPAHADQTLPEIHASAPTSVAVTIYRDDLALITETRRVDLPGGPARIVFDGVLDRAIPQSAIVRGLEGFERERNFDFDGLNPMSLLWRSIGAVVRIVRTAPGSGAVSEEEATVQAAGDGVTLRFADRYEALGCSGLPEKLIFARIPDGLRARPALSTLLTDTTAGTKEITLSYLATGLAWKTDYVVTLSADSTRADVAAWITLTNAGEEGFADAQVGVVAGDLSRVWDDETRRGMRRIAQRACWPSGTTSDFPQPPPPPPPPPAPMMMAPMARAEMAQDDNIVVTGARIPKREELADYQLYKFGEPTSVAPQQTKQVMFLHKDAVTIARVLRYEVGDGTTVDAQPTTALLRTKNEDAHGLGEPLPKGDARVFAPLTIGSHDLGVLFSGQSDTRDTAVGLDWELQTGESHDVTVQETVVSERSRRLSGDRKRVIDDMRLEIANATGAAQTVEIVQPVRGGSQHIGKESARHVMKDGAPTWTVQAPAHARFTLTYRVSYIVD